MKKGAVNFVKPFQQGSHICLQLDGEQGVKRSQGRETMTHSGTGGEDVPGATGSQEVHRSETFAGKGSKLTPIKVKRSKTATTGAKRRYYKVQKEEEGQA